MISTSTVPYWIFMTPLITNSPKRHCWQGVNALSEVALITGSTDGIGVTTARSILIGNNDVTEVWIHGRDPDRIERMVSSLQKTAENERFSTKGSLLSTATNNIVLALPAADLSTARGCYDLVTSVLEHCSDRSCTSSGATATATAADTSSKLKLLMNNAGVYSNDLVRTQDGLELTFAVNVLAPFVLTSMLLSELLANGISSKKSSRVVIASSISQSWKLPYDYWDDPQYLKRPYSAHSAYSESKLLDAMLTIEMAHRLHDLAGIDTSVVTCNCLDPGTVNTKMLLDGWGPIGMRVEDALDETWCCTSPELEEVSGQFFVGQSSRRASGCAYDPIHREKLWQTLSALAPKAAAEWDRTVDFYSTKEF